MELPSLPMTINRVPWAGICFVSDGATPRHSWPWVGAAILLRPLSPNTIIMPALLLRKDPPHTLYMTLGWFC